MYHAVCMLHNRAFGCLNARESLNEHWPFVVQRFQSPLGVVLGILYVFSFRVSFFRSPYRRSVLVSMSRFE